MAPITSPSFVLTRRTVTGCLAGTLAAGVLGAACTPGGGRSDTVPPATRPTGTVTFWHSWSARRDLLRTYLDQFERENAGVTVEDTDAQRLGGREKITAAVLAGTPPDCLHLFREMYPLLVPSKAVVPLNPYMARDKIDPKIFVEADLKARTVGGQVLALPSISGTGGLSLYWNKEHFRQVGLDPEKPPQTWSQLELFAQRLTQGQGDGVTRLGVDPILGRRNAGGDYSRFVAFLYANDGRVVSDDGRRVAFDGKEGLDTLVWMTNLVRRNGGPEAVQKITDRDAFYRGQLSMFPEQDLFPSLIRLDPNGRDLNWGVAPLPYNDRNSKAKTRIPTSGGHGYSVTTGAKNAEGAWQLAKFLAASDAQCAFQTREQGRVSPLIKCNSDPEVVKRPEFQVFSKLVNSVVQIPFIPDPIGFLAVIEKHSKEAVFGRVSPDAALRVAAQEAQAELDRSWREWKV